MKNLDLSSSQRNKIFVSSVCLCLLILTVRVWADPEPVWFPPSFFGRLFAAYQTGNLQTLRLTTNAPGLRPFSILFVEVLNLTHETILKFPVGIIGRAIMMFILIREITSRVWLAQVISLSMLLSPWSSWGFNSIFIHSLGSISFLLFGWIIVRYRTPSNKQHLLLGLAIIMLWLYDYTMIVWAILTLFTLMSYDIINKRSQKRWIGWMCLTSVIYMLKHQPYQVISKTFAALVFDIGGFLPNPAPDPESPYIFTQSPPLISFSKLLYIFCGIVVAISVSQVMYSIYKKRPLPHWIIPVSALSAGGTGGLLIYAFVFGRFTQTFIYLWTPVLALIGIGYLFEQNILQKASWTETIVPMLIVICLIGAPLGSLAVEYQTNQFNSLPDRSLDSTSEWIVEYDSNQHITMLGDAKLLDNFIYRLYQMENKPEFKFYNLSTYDALISGSSPPVEWTVAADNTPYTQSIGWTTLQPLNKYWFSVQVNPTINRVYDKGNEQLYRKIYKF